MESTTLWVISSVLFAAVQLGSTGVYYGESVGSLTTRAHSVSGDVYLVDRSRIRLVNFNYDGTAPDAYFYAGIRGKTSSPGAAAADGTILPDENGRMVKLGRYINDDIVLTLSPSDSVSDILWISVWCRNFSVNFGDLVFPTSVRVPAERDIGRFSTLAHQVASGNVIIRDAKTFYIPDFNYDGAGPDAFLLVGTGPRPHDRGQKVPDEEGNTGKLKGYNRQSIVITLPGDLTVYDIDWISVYCISYRHDFGNIILPANSDLVVPPAVDTMRTEPLANCIHLDKYLNVEWQVDADLISVEMTGALEAEGGYMAFGISGSDDRSAMVGSDVFVAYQDDSPAMVKVDDYKITAYSMCDGQNEGVCPDTQRNGTNGLNVISARIRDGITSVRFTRKLTPSDSDNDLPIPADDDVFVVWAMGRLTSSAPFHVTKHDRRLDGNTMINFGAASTGQCDAVMHRDAAAITPWQAQSINSDGKITTTFRVRIGPAGGARGYTAITGQQSWGIAYYVNDLLIPEIYVKRNVTYTFIIEAGDDASRTARYHPFYITNDRTGGYSKKSEADKQAVTNYLGVDAQGNPTAGAAGRYCEYEHKSTDQASVSETFEEYFDTLKLNCQPGSPGTLTWTPDVSTPDLLYYQCWAHNYLGFKIHVVEEYPVSTASQLHQTSFLTALLLGVTALCISRHM